MKIRLMDKGFVNYSGPLGGYEFINGVSETDVSESAINRLAAIMLVESAEGGEQLGIAAQMVANANTEMEVVEPLERDSALSETNSPDDSIESSDNQLEGESDEEYGQDVEITREYLERAADEGGIKGIRAIADQCGIRGTSINQLIEALLLKTQGVE